MFSKQQFLESVSQETKVAKHLAEKISSEQLDYQPDESVRNTLELMRYMTYCGMGPMRAVLEGDWGLVSNMASAAADMTGADFSVRMDAQLAAIEEALAGVSDEDLAGRDVTLPWGVTDKLGAVLVNTSLKFLTAYRMQLFVHAKSSGCSELNTMNCWMGVDPPPKAG